MKCNPLDSDYRQIYPDGIQNQSFCIVHALPGKDQSECNTHVPPPAARTHKLRHRKHDGEDTTPKEQEEEGCSETRGDRSCVTTC